MCVGSGVDVSEDYGVFNLVRFRLNARYNFNVGEFQTKVSLGLSIVHLSIWFKKKIGSKKNSASKYFRLEFKIFKPLLTFHPTTSILSLTSTPLALFFL